MAISESASAANGIPQSAEMSPGPGFRIRSRIERPPAGLLRRFAAIDVTLVSDLMNRLYTLRPELHTVVPGPDGKFVGPACTVKLFPGDNLMVHAALTYAEPGDVIVADTAGNRTTAVVGDMITNKARTCGIAGFLVDGLVRDVEGMRAAGVPVIAAGVTPRGPLHRGPGELNYPVSCGGVTVMPGDIVMADPDGVVVIPRDAAEEVLERAERKMAAEQDYVREVRRGNFSNDWVDSLLDIEGCQID